MSQVGDSRSGSSPNSRIRHFVAFLRRCLRFISFKFSCKTSTDMGPLICDSTNLYPPSLPVVFSADPWVPSPLIDPLVTDIRAQKDLTKTAFTLIRAAMRGSLQELRALLDAGVSPDSQYANWTALGEAAAKGHLYCLAALLKAGADVNFTMTGVSPLMAAILGNHSHCCDELLQHSAINLDAIDNDRCSTLMYAARAGNYRLSRIILGDRPTCPKEMDLNYENVINHAAVNGHKSYLRRMLPKLWLSNEVIKAAAANDEDKLQRLLDDGRDPNEIEFGNLTALMICSILDNRQCLDLLLQHGASVDKCDDSGSSALHYAASCSNCYCLERLLESGATASLINRHKENILLILAKNGALDCTRAVLRTIFHENDMLSQDVVADKAPSSRSLQSKAQALSKLEVFDIAFKTALMSASERGFLEVVRLLLDRGANVDASSHFDGKTALIYAVSSGHIDVMKLLLKRGANVSAKDKDGYSALHYAAENGRIGCVLHLLQVGANASLCKQGQNPLFKALENKHSECAAALIRFMTLDELHHEDSSGRNAMIYAAKNGEVVAFQLMLRRGLNPNSRDNFGNTLLMFATVYCHRQFVEYLVKRVKVSVNDFNNTAVNALWLAVYYKVPAHLLQYLIDTGSHFEVYETPTGISPLHLAAQNRNASHLRSLLAKGANIAQTDANYHPAIVYAGRGGDVSVVNLVVEAERAQGLMVPDEAHKRALFFAVDGGHLECARRILQLGLFHWDWYPNCFGNIRMDMKMLLRSLVVSGMSPGSFTSGRQESSPLLFAFEIMDVPTIKYLISNLYFTTNDYNHLLRRQSSIRGPLDEHCDPSAGVLAESLFSRPMPLSTLSFLTVSTAVGNHCTELFGRRDAVNQLPLPDFYKRKLSYQEPVAKLCCHDWGQIIFDEADCLRRGGGLPYSLFRMFTKTVQWQMLPFMLDQCIRPACGSACDGLSFLAISRTHYFCEHMHCLISQMENFVFGL